MSYSTLTIARDGDVERVTLNRPDVRNAFNPALIDELGDWARTLAATREVRVAVLAGAGKAFSAGADLAWMAEAAGYTRERNAEDADLMAAMFAALDALPVPLVGIVQGAALGGGVGLVAVCDIVVAEEQAVFGFTETRLGLVPAVISPYVIAKIGVSAARELFLTGARFNAARAKELNLVHAVVAAAQLQATAGEYVKELLASGPEAIAAAKRLVRDVTSTPRDGLRPLTVEAIAERRVSAEGQEGIRAFLEKRKPRWVQ